MQRIKNRRPNGEGEREVKPQPTMKISELHVYSYIAESCTFKVRISEKTSSLIRKITNSFLRLKSSHCILSIHFEIQKAFFFGGGGGSHEFLSTVDKMQDGFITITFRDIITFAVSSSPTSLPRSACPCSQAFLLHTDYKQLRQQ